MLASQEVSPSTNYTYIDRGHMLQDNALKFYRDQAYVINKNGLLAAILNILEILTTSIEATCFEIML